MTAIPPSPGLNMEHGFVKHIEQRQFHRLNQVSSEQVRKQETAKLAKKVGQTNRPARPTKQIYRPPSVRGSASVDDISSFQMINGQYQAQEIDYSQQQQHQSQTALNGMGGGRAKVTFNLDNKLELKSALKRSKSFGGSEAMESAWQDRQDFAQFGEFQTLVKKALDNPNNLTSRQLMEVVSILCSKAVENTQSAEPAAQLCFTIIQKETGDTFLESLMNSCREWFNERDKLLPRYMGNPPGGQFRRWTAYISFLMELYLRLKSRHHQLSAAAETNGQTFNLLTLIYESCQIILTTAVMNNVAEMECLRSVLMSVGKPLEEECPSRMFRLMCFARDAFLNQSVSDQVRKVLLELIELRASNWNFDLAQSMYYFPYTTCMDRKGI